MLKRVVHPKKMGPHLRIFLLCGKVQYYTAHVLTDLCSITTRAVYPAVQNTVVQSSLNF